MIDGVQLDRRLAEAVGYRYADGNEVMIRVYKDKYNVVPRYFRPHEDLSDAWEALEKLGVNELVLDRGKVWKYRAMVRWGSGQYVSYALCEGETVAMTLCKAALKIIEGGKSNAHVSS